MIVTVKRPIWVMVMAFGLLGAAAAGESWVGDFRLLGNVTAAAVSDHEVAFTSESPEKAALLASKFIADMLAFGDVKAHDDGKTFEIPGVGFRLVLLDGSVTRVLTAPTLTALTDRDGAAGGRAAERNLHPKWFDRFDNGALGCGALGWGILPADYRPGMDWLGENRFGPIAENNNPNMQLAPGVWDYTVTDFYRAVARKNGSPYQIYIPWALPDFPAHFWNRSPLPWYRAVDDAVAHPELPNQRVASNSWYEPVDSSRDLIATMYAELARRTAGDPDFGNHFGIVELGHNLVLNSIGYSATPEALAAWRQYLAMSLDGDLARAGRLLRNDPDAYPTWDAVEFPTFLNLVNRSGDFLDLRGVWEMHYDAEGAETPPENAEWRKVSVNDSILALFDRAPGKLWLRRAFDLPEGRTYSHLHISRNAWHGRKNILFKVRINDAPLKDLTVEHPLTGDLDQCLESGDALRPGRNTLLLEAGGQSVPFYILLNNEGRFTYPGDDADRNQCYFEWVEFVARYRLAGVENVLSAIRAGDPDGRPIQVMAPGDLLDRIQPLLRRYGAYPHDTGQNAAVWAPWTTRYAATHGLPISSEPGGAPSDVAGMRQMITLYLMTGNDAVNLLFDPTQYRQNGIDDWIRDNGELLNAIGKMEMPLGDVGVLRSVRNASRLHSGIPWSHDPSRGALQASGRTCNLVTLDDFVEKRVPFRVVLDAGTEIMTDRETAAILDFVREGGVFVAMQHTGTHSERERFAWPLEKLSGLKVVSRGTGGRIRFTDAQTLWPAWRGKEIPAWGQILDWRGEEAPQQGLHLQPNDPDIEVIAEWIGRKPEEGNIAFASRRVGKGRVFVMGSGFLRRERDLGGSYSMEAGAYPYLSEMLDRLNVPRTSGGHGEAGMRNVFAETWRSKNGLYDLFLVARIHNRGEGAKAAPRFFNVIRPTRLWEFSAPGHPETPFRFEDRVLTLEEISLDPMEMRIFAAPRLDAALSPLFWLRTLHKRQYALAPVADPPAPDRPDGDTLGLNDDWEVVAADPDPAGLTGKTVTLGAFNTLGFPDEAVVRFRKRFTVPEAWKGDRIELGLSSQYWFWGVVPNGRLLLDGGELHTFSPKPNGAFAVWLPDAEAGAHTLELEIDGRLAAHVNRTRPSGVTGLFYMQRVPVPVATLPFVEWKKADGVNDFVRVKTGRNRSFLYLENEFPTPDGDWQTINLEASEPLGWVCLNGVWLSTPGHFRRLNVTGLLHRDGTPNVLRWMPGLVKETPNIRRVLRGTIPALHLACY